MSTKKEDFIFQLQFDLGDRWPDLEVSSVQTIDALADFILKRNVSSKWHFTRFLPIYQALTNWLKTHTNHTISANFDLNSLSKVEKKDLLTYIQQSLGTPLTFRRPPALHTLVFVAPVVLILLPMLISTYLVTGLDMSGWVYLSGLLGLGVSLALFALTTPQKALFHPATLLQYSKSFYVINNQQITKDATKAQIIDYLSEAGSDFYKKSIVATSIIPEA
jgi:hypothetical protein